MNFGKYAFMSENKSFCEFKKMSIITKFSFVSFCNDFIIERRKSIEFDRSTKQAIGFIDPRLSNAPKEKCLSTPADKTLVIILRGLALHWKQIVAYYFVGRLNRLE